MSKLRRASLVLLVSAASLPLMGFGTINGTAMGIVKEQHAEHEKITRLGLGGLGFDSLTLDEVAGRGWVFLSPGTFGAVGSPDIPSQLGGTLIDEPKAHCDRGDYDPKRPGYPQSKQEAQGKINNCRQWIKERFDVAVRDAGNLARADGSVVAKEGTMGSVCALRATAKCKVIYAMGEVLHASQDFYSHSNWSDQPAEPVGPPGLGSHVVAPFMQIGHLDAALPDGLMTGCFEEKDEENHCNYTSGGVKQNRFKHMHLNKDLGLIDLNNLSRSTGTTDRGMVDHNFANAVTLAVADTRAKWQALEAAIRARYQSKQAAAIVCALKSDDADAWFKSRCDQPS